MSPSFTYKWNATTQQYTIYKDNKFLIIVYSFKEVKNYIN